MVDLKRETANELTDKINNYKEHLLSLLPEYKRDDAVSNKETPYLKETLIKEQVKILNQIIDEFNNNIISQEEAMEKFVVVRQFVMTSILNIQYTILSENDWLRCNDYNIKSLTFSLEQNNVTFRRMVEPTYMKSLPIAKIFFLSLDKDDLLEKIARVNIGAVYYLNASGSESASFYFLLEILKHCEDFLLHMDNTLIDNIFQKQDYKMLASIVDIIFQAANTQEDNIHILFKLIMLFNTTRNIEKLVEMTAAKGVNPLDISTDESVLFGHLKCLNSLTNNPDISRVFSRILTRYISEDDEIRLFCNDTRCRHKNGNLLHTFIMDYLHGLTSKIFVSGLSLNLLLKLCEQNNSDGYNAITLAIMVKPEIAIYIINRFQGNPALQDIITSKNNSALDLAQSKKYKNDKVSNSIINYLESLNPKNSPEQAVLAPIQQESENDISVISNTIAVEGSLLTAGFNLNETAVTTDKSQQQHLDIKWNDLRNQHMGA